jgi:hypothetical protein
MRNNSSSFSTLGLFLSPNTLKTPPFQFAAGFYEFNFRFYGKIFSGPNSLPFSYLPFSFLLRIERFPSFNIPTIGGEASGLLHYFILRQGPLPSLLRRFDGLDGGRTWQTDIRNWTRNKILLEIWRARKVAKKIVINKWVSREIEKNE